MHRPPNSDSVSPTVSWLPIAGRLVFGAARTSLDRGDQGPVLRVAVPVLAGVKNEVPLPIDGVEPSTDGVVFRSGSCLGGFFLAATEGALDSAAAELYRQLLRAAGGHRLYRIWNFVPRLNEIQCDLENYRSFCRGRSLAFAEYFGHGYERLLPAASGVGSESGPLAVAFIAGKDEARHFENPLQVPAFEYPPRYGPRPPSFARATAVGDGPGRRIFVSGTAAIRGHASVAAGDLDGQLDCTLGNLRLIHATAGAGATTGAGWQRSFRVYLRRAGDLAQVQERLSRDLLRAGDSIQYLRADICRSDLLVEIEAVFELRA